MFKDENYEEILEKLVSVKEQLEKISQVTGTADRVEKMRGEILEFGWHYILGKYHPDVNLEDPAAHELFIMYKFVYEDMIRRQMII